MNKIPIFFLLFLVASMGFVTIPNVSYADYVGLMIKNLKDKRTKLVKNIEDESVDIKNLKLKANYSSLTYGFAFK